MPAVSQGLVDFANNLRQQAAPGVEVIVTPRYQITLQPDFPIPGPNSVSWVRCRPDEAGEVIPVPIRVNAMGREVFREIVRLHVDLARRRP